MQITWPTTIHSRKLTRDVPEGLCHARVCVVDDARSFALNSSAVPHLTFAGTHALGGVHLWTVTGATLSMETTQLVPKAYRMVITAGKIDLQ